MNNWDFSRYYENLFRSSNPNADEDIERTNVERKQYNFKKPGFRSGKQKFKLNEYRKANLAAHNKFRKQHNVEPLTLSNKVKG